MDADANVLTVEFKLNLLAPGNGALLIARPCDQSRTDAGGLPVGRFCDEER